MFNTAFVKDRYDSENEDLQIRNGKPSFSVFPELPLGTVYTLLINRVFFSDLVTQLM